MINTLLFDHNISEGITIIVITVDDNNTWIRHFLCHPAVVS